MGIAEYFWSNKRKEHLPAKPVVQVAQCVGRPEWYAARLLLGESFHDYFVMQPDGKTGWSKLCSHGHWKSLDELLYRLKQDGVTEVVVQIGFMEQSAEQGINGNFY